MISRGIKIGMVFECSVFGCLYFWWEIFTAAVYGSDFGSCADDGQAVFVDFVAVLFCDIRKAGGRRYLARNERNAPVYGSDVY